MKKTQLVENLFRLTRALCRRPHKDGRRSHGSGKLLSLLGENENVTSRELAELLDVRPSSLTEMLTRLDSEGLVTRTTDENDKRVTRVALTDSGKALLAQVEREREDDAEKLAACFTDEEAEQFSALCEKLYTHLESLNAQERSGCDFPPPPPFGEDGCMMPPPHHRHHCPPEFGHMPGMPPRHHVKPRKLDR